MALDNFRWWLVSRKTKPTLEFETSSPTIHPLGRGEEHEIEFISNLVCEEAFIKKTLTYMRVSSQLLAAFRWVAK